MSPNLKPFENYRLSVWERELRTVKINREIIQVGLISPLFILQLCRMCIEKTESTTQIVSPCPYLSIKESISNKT